MKRYLCIDLKSFYASVECIERKIDPLTSYLVVADEKRGGGAITLAVTPSMKKLGVSSRGRVFQIPKNVSYIMAKPRMSLYIKYSADIYGVYLKYFSSDDIHVYSIDEVFIDITSYIKLYNMSDREIALMVMKDVLETTGITSTCGIGANLYLAKIALDIYSKRCPDNIGFLDEVSFKKELWNHRPLIDFWQIGEGISKKLENMGIYNMRQLYFSNHKRLYREFGVNAEILIDHSIGVESCTISDIKKYKPKGNSFSNSQMLFRNYNYDEVMVLVEEMLYEMVIRLKKDKSVCRGISFFVCYSKEVISHSGASKKLSRDSDSYEELLKEIKCIFERNINKNIGIRKISIGFFDVSKREFGQISLFDNNLEENNSDDKLFDTMSELKDKYGKNILLKGISYTSEGRQRFRNSLIGGHNAE